jgi:DNA invertase Pin-like site-specific DNA recombinase
LIVGFKRATGPGSNPGFIDTLLTVLGGLAEFERELIRARTGVRRSLVMRWSEN